MRNNCFINLTNHPSDKWDENQRKAANEYGTIIDIPFPSVNSTATEAEIEQLCGDIVEKVMKYNPYVVLCQGEFTLAFQIINTLLDKGVVVVAACSERKAIVNGNRKELYFDFTKFRKFER